MSIEALRWARKARAGKAKGMLLVLAEIANPTGYCFPSHAYLAESCELSESTVRRMIKLLASRKLLTIKRRFHKNGSCSSNAYLLAVGDPVNVKGRVVSLTGRMSAAGQEACSSVTSPPVNGEQETTTEPVFYPTPLPPAFGAGATAKLKQTPGRGGGEFCFPKAVSEAQCRELEKRVAGLSREVAQQVLDELAGRMAMEQVRNPIRYCAALVASARRGEFQPELCVQVADQRAVDQQREAQRRASVAAARIAHKASEKSLPQSLRAPLERMRARRDATLADGAVSGERTLDGVSDDPPG